MARCDERTVHLRGPEFYQLLVKPPLPLLHIFRVQVFPFVALNIIVVVSLFYTVGCGGSLFFFFYTSFYPPHLANVWYIVSLPHRFVE